MSTVVGLLGLAVFTTHDRARRGDDHRSLSHPSGRTRSDTLFAW